MVSDGIPSASLPSFSKKNRTNRLAKLKQCKLDARREQWLSQQVQNKGLKLDPNMKDELPLSSMKVSDKQNKSSACCRTRSRSKENKDLGAHNGNLDALMSNPIASGLGYKNSEVDPRSSCSSSSTTSGPCSGNVSEEEDCCLDNWEALADTLIAGNNKYNSDSNATTKCEAKAEAADVEGSYNCQGANLSTENRGRVCGSRMNCRAWRPDDAFRPRTLPSISKQRDQHSDHGAITWALPCMVSQPSSCPICCEDLDTTDSSFLPCSCGYRLCLFCHKRILEDDGRCPGCRRHYDSLNGNISFNKRVIPFQVARSCSMSTES